MIVPDVFAMVPSFCPSCGRAGRFVFEAALGGALDSPDGGLSALVSPTAEPGCGHNLGIFFK